ncbi:hypothetical protein F4806DRAFT_445703 [Annulohypoxylon nitens]|nr:hypothetical protein F4806DRAFT_445703 [Annulohypoxylon nitens]
MHLLLSFLLFVASQKQAVPAVLKSSSCELAISRYNHPSRLPWSGFEHFAHHNLGHRKSLRNEPTAAPICLI